MRERMQEFVLVFSFFFSLLASSVFHFLALESALGVVGLRVSARLGIPCLTLRIRSTIIFSFLFHVRRY